MCRVPFPSVTLIRWGVENSPGGGCVGSFSVCPAALTIRIPGGRKNRGARRLGFWEYSGETKSVKIIQRARKAAKSVSDTPA